MKELTGTRGARPTETPEEGKSIRKRSISFFTSLRTYTALASTSILNLGAFGLKFKSVCSPGFHCHGCPWASAACPIGVFAYSSAVRTFPALAAGTILGIGALFGRMACGFACPFGLFQELLYKIPSPKIRLPRFTRWGKYAALALLVLIFPFLLGFKPVGGLAVHKPQVDKAEGDQLAVVVTVQNFGSEPIRSPELNVAFREKAGGAESFRAHQTFPDATVPPGERLALPAFNVPNKLATADLVIDSPQSEIMQLSPYELYYCRVCPEAALTAKLPDYAATPRSQLGPKLRRHAPALGILGVFLVLMVLVSRPFCRSFCPLGAIYALTSRLALWRVKVHEPDCIHCGLCSKVCPTDLDVPREAGGPECVACGDCIRACPKGAIRREFGL